MAQAERSTQYLSQELKELATVGEERIAALEAGLSVARRLATQREHRIGAMLNSNSWRITAPLRWLRRKLSLRG